MDIDKIFKVLEYVGNISDSGSIAVSVFIQLAISILVVSALRIGFILRSAKIKIIGEKKYIKQRAIILNHCGLEILINLIFSYFLLLLLNTSNNNLIMNMLISPLLGQVVAICIDDWYLIPKEKEGIFDKIPNHEKISSANTITNLVEIHGMLDSSLSESEEFRPVIIQAINEIKKIQEEHETKITDIQQKCDSTVDYLKKMQNAAMRDKKIVIKQEIYDCLNAGFVTPKQRDKIQLEYESYLDLGGNGEIEKLYEEHFVKLSVHEDRRRIELEVENDRRQPFKCEYGSLD